MFNELKINTIFWKIFLSYWAAMILTILMTAFLVSVVFDRDRTQLRQELDDSFFANAALLVFEEGGAPALKRWLRRRAPDRGKHTWFIDESGEDVLGKRLSNPVQQMISSGEAVAAESGRWVLVQVESSLNEKFWYVSLVKRQRADRRPPGRLFPFLSPESHRHGKWHGEWRSAKQHWRKEQDQLGRNTLLFIALVLSGAVSWLLARHFSSPIRQLQGAARGITSGDLSVRVDPGLARRRDEFGELGKDFDRMAETIDQLMRTQKRLLGDVSHELRTPLARLQVALELARKSAGGLAAQEHERIEKEARKLDELIGQVLSLVRLSSRTEALEIRQCDLMALLQQTIDDANFEAQASNKSVVLEQHEPVELRVNSELLHSAFENIVRNAVRYTGEGTAVAVALTTDTNQVKIAIRDHGPGVSDQAIEHLFEPFYRESAARDRASGGYGLGLAIAERAIALHDGSVSARNAVDGGLVIEIVLPKR